MKYIDVFGLYGIVLYAKIMYGFSEKISISGFSFPVIVRRNTSDKFVFNQIFIEEEYNIEFSIYPKIILDAGANTGLSAIFFSKKYPLARIIAIEPEENNYRLLVENTKYYNNIICLQRALADTQNQRLAVVSKGLGEWGFVTEKIENQKNINQQILSITVDEIVEKYDIESIDIFKIDIEGAEKELFESNFENWLPKTQNIIIEFHDRIKTGCSDSFYKAIGNYNFKSFAKGENYIFVNKEIG